MKIDEQQKGAITEAINNLFYTLKAKILGRFFKGPKIFFEVVQTSNPLESLEGLFRYTYQMLNPGKEPEETTVKTLAVITGNYIESERLRTIDRIITAVEEAENESAISEAVKTGIDKATKYIDMLVNNEARVIQAYAERAGISQVAADIGVEDPIVAKLGVIDERMCDNCRELWHSPENIKIPKVYKMSELVEGYNKDHKNPIPTIGPTHPRCRHVMTFVPPNFGFGSNGQIQFKGFGHDEYIAQHGTQKTESLPASVIDDTDGMFDFSLDDDHLD